ACRRLSCGAQSLFASSMRSSSNCLQQKLGFAPALRCHAHADRQECLSYPIGRSIHHSEDGFNHNSRARWALVLPDSACTSYNLTCLMTKEYRPRHVEL